MIAELTEALIHEKKRALGLPEAKRFSSVNKSIVLEFVPWIAERGGLSLRNVCKHLEINWNRYQRWRRIQRRAEPLEDRIPAAGVHPASPLPWEVSATIDYALAHPTDGYRRLTWMMVDDDVTCLSESAVYRILSQRGLLRRWARPQRHSAQAPPPATAPNERWHTDIMHLRIGDVWYFLVSFLDAYSRYIVHWELLTTMTAEEVTLAQLAALEKYPDARPQIVSDRGCQYTSREYKALIRRFELAHIKCRVAHPQSNGLIERWHRSTRDALEESMPTDYLRAKDAIAAWVDEYNERRLHAGLRYIQPAEYFRGDPETRMKERRQKVTKARENRRAVNSRPEPEQAPGLGTADELPTACVSAAHSRGAAVYG